jgi:DNA repair protein RecN (Recombination protein N)
MLSELQVKNLALIESLRLSFGPGANILTGETGAGKSILAGALGLIRGSKASPDMVRAGAEALTVEALFTPASPEDYLPLFEAQGITPDSEIILKRVVLPNGRSRCYLNGSFITLKQLSLWGEEFLAISSQNDQQSLLKQGKQLDFTDSYGGHGELLKKMAEAHKNRTEIKAKLDQINKEIETLNDKKDFYEFQLKEIRKVSPKPGEDDELSAMKARRKEDARLIGLLDDALNVFYSQDGLLTQMEKATSLTNKAHLSDAELGPISERLREILTELGDASKSLKDKRKSLGSLNDKDLDAVEERLSELSKLKRKYGPTLSGVLQREEELKDSIAKADVLGLEAIDLSKKLRDAERKAEEIAVILHDKRLESGKALASELMEVLKFLGFTDAEIEIEVLFSKPTLSPGSYADAKGADVVTFLFCPNPGEGLRPLSRIASGGELSRIMLALKTVQAARSDQSLVFDEIDSGLSGAASEAVAEKMAELCRRQQIFVITHQPMMASIPGKHFLARKNPEKGRTLTFIDELSEEKRLEELARMLDGKTPSPQAIALSRRLLGVDAPEEAK